MATKEFHSKTEIVYHESRSLLYGTLGACWYTFPGKTYVETVVRQGIFNLFDYIDGLDVFNKGIKKVRRWVNDAIRETVVIE